MNDGNRGLVNKAWSVLWDAINHLNADDGWAMASNVALSVLMALFPFIIFVAAMAGTFGDPGLATRVAEMLFETWPHEVARPLADEVYQVLRPTHGGLLTLSAVFALYLASNGVEAVRTALNRAYRVIDRRSFIARRVQSLLFVFLGTLVIVILAGLAVLAAATPLAAQLPNYFRIASAIFSGILLVVVLFIAHLWLPAGRPPWYRLWPGILLTVVAWALFAWGFAIYLGTTFANYATTYAGLASVVIVIFFLYVVAVVMIFGAELNAALGRLRDGQI